MNLVPRPLTLTENNWGITLQQAAFFFQVIGRSERFLSNKATAPNPNPLISKLGRFVSFTEEEEDALRHLGRNARLYRRGSNLIAEGDKSDSLFLILEGWAFRYKHLEDGRRQIMAYLIPGDLCDIRVFMFEEMDHSIGLLSDAKVLKISAAEMLELLDRFPRIERALLWAALVDEATLREWLMNLGQRSALHKIGHLFCELGVRMHVVNLVDAEYLFDLPLTQTELADTTGMTTMQVQRSLKTLRKAGLVRTGRRKLTILDFERLSKLAGFSQTYLHVDGPPIEQKLRVRLAKLV